MKNATAPLAAILLTVTLSLTSPAMADDVGVPPPCPSEGCPPPTEPDQCPVMDAESTEALEFEIDLLRMSLRFEHRELRRAYRAIVRKDARIVRLLRRLQAR